MPFYLIDVSADNDAADSLEYDQSNTLVREMMVARAEGSLISGGATYNFDPGDIACDLDPTFLPTIPSAGWTEIDGYAYRGISVAMLKAAETPVYYLCDISDDANGANLASYTDAAPATQDILYAQSALTYAGIAPNITLADGDFIVAFHPDRVPTIPAAGWTRLNSETYAGLRIEIIKDAG